METYTDSQGVEHCDNCGADVDTCDCRCTECGDLVQECACDEGPTYPVVGDWARVGEEDA